jgi:hypothetical protein
MFRAMTRAFTMISVATLPMILSSVVWAAGFDPESRRQLSTLPIPTISAALSRPQIASSMAANAMPIKQWAIQPIRRSPCTGGGAATGSRRNSPRARWGKPVIH